MRQKSQTRQTGAAKAIKDIRRATRKQYSAEEKIRIVLDGLRGEETIAGVMPPGRHCPEHLLQVVEGVSGSWQAPACRRYGPCGLYGRGARPFAARRVS